MNCYDLVFMATHFKFVQGHLVTVCPPGVAHNSFLLRSRGLGLEYANVDRWPDEHFRLTTGGTMHFRDLSLGHLCFQQELYVYRRELQASMQEAMELLKVRFEDENPRKDLHEKTCLFCQLSFKGHHSSKYCSAKCRLKHQTWQKIQEEIRKLEIKPEIYSHGDSWLIKGVRLRPGRRSGFDTFSEAAACLLSSQR